MEREEHKEGDMNTKILQHLLTGIFREFSLHFLFQFITKNSVQLLHIMLHKCVGTADNKKKKKDTSEPKERREKKEKGEKKEGKKERDDLLVPTKTRCESTGAHAAHCGVLHSVHEKKIF